MLDLTSCTERRAAGPNPNTENLADRFAPIKGEWHYAAASPQAAQLPSTPAFLLDSALRWCNPSPPIHGRHFLKRVRSGWRSKQ